MDSLANARMGIELIQSGQRAEAINYLRRSVQVEPVTAEVWLWLAHVSADYHEYSHCVQQALSLDPQHHIALQMHHALQQMSGYPAMQQPMPRSTGQYPAVAPPNAFSSSQMLAVDGSLVASLEKKGKTRKLRRRLLSILFVCTVLIIVAVVVLSTSGQSVEDWFSELFSDDKSAEDGETILITLPPSIGDSVSFEVTLPDTWMLADTNSTAWIETRDELREKYGEEGESTFWERVEVDLDAVTLSGDRLSPPVTIVETNVDGANRDPDNPPWLQLVRIVDLPDGLDGTSCETIRQIAESEAAELEQIDDERQSVVDYGVEEQDSGQCIFVVHFRDQSPLTNLVEHKYVIQIPLDNDRLAEWHLTVIDELHEDYESVVQTVMRTLKARDS